MPPKAATIGLFLAVKHLTALSSGTLGKSNVYVRPQGKVQDGNQTYIVFLPGLKATVLGLADSSYYVLCK